MVIRPYNDFKLLLGNRDADTTQSYGNGLTITFL